MDEKQQAIFSSGTSVGELARKLYPGGVDATPPDTYSYAKSVMLTQDLIKQGKEVIYEAAFQHSGVLCALDILVKNNGRWYAFEVKSTTGVKDQHLDDAALQYFVITQTGLELEDISLVYLNNEYERRGEIDVNALFSITSILENVMPRQQHVRNKINDLKSLLAKKAEPAVDIGPHCGDPYPCDFTNHCWSHIPKEDSIFDLARGPGWKLYEDGFTHLDQIPEDYPMSSTAKRQLTHYLSGEATIDKQSIGEFISTISYPAYFFDFETMMPAVPEYDNSRPYQQVPFQFSLHVQASPGAELKHYAYLGDGNTDPRLGLIKSMLERIGETGSIICYNMSFERSRIKELATQFPMYAKKLLAIEERIVDLMIPFQKGWYYHPNFKGSYSIKAVLPVLIPELRYDNLVIKEGGTASMVYAQLKNQDPETAELQREHLLAYCELDTLAMVRILNYLKGLVR